ncbi:MAG TPA: hypothetical protein ENI26_13090 [Methylophaga aminisulfidivorans]|uniref:TniQ domain-containing protein n=1 Tax=Methylophaga aminisulfidivorans TaxID=230105 RepID=A0A7C1ZTG4_9GAMM|nr:hypothetical protein [Methylophaga aminisulfidivorans]
MKLLATCIPYRDESAYGLLHRAAKANGFLSTKDFLHSQTTKTSLFSAVSSHDCLLNSAIYGNIKTDFVYRPTRLEKPTISFRKVHIDRSLLRIAERYVCAQCVKETGYAPYLWDYGLVTACIRHKTRLASQCLHCQKPFSWNETTPLGCDCVGAMRHINLSDDEIASQIKLTAWLKSGAQQKITEVESIYFCLEQINRVIGKKVTHTKLVTLSIKALSNEGFFLDEILNRINQSKLPNRIKLYPLLASLNQTTKQLGEKLLGQALPMPILNSLSLPRINLSTTETAGILNISTGQLSQFFEKNIIAHHRTSSTGKKLIKLADVYTLLQQLSLLKKEPSHKSLCINEVVKNPNYHLPLSNLVSDLLNGRNVITEFDLEQGLTGLRLSSVKMSAELSQYTEDFMSIEEAADTFKHSKHHISNLLNTEFLPSTNAMGNTNKILIRKQDMIDFDKKYIIGPELANNASLRPTAFCLKVIAYGIKALAGPSIDGSKTYLFRREDIRKLDLNAVERATVSHLPMRSGRPKLTDNRNSDAVTLNQIKAELKIDTYLLRKLLGKRILKKHQGLGHKALVTKASYERLKHLLDKRYYIKLEDVLKSLNMKKNNFVMKFVQTKLCSIEDIFIAKVIKKSEFQKIEKLHREYITSAEANTLYFNSTSKMNNMQKQGLITPAMQLRGWTTSINFWDRNDVIKLL